ncbi:MAG: hypothetical protein M0010_15370 [Actinomycetota bacterium]|nr:hypothetical protein [Actinomycetota bacterium]
MASSDQPQYIDEHHQRFVEFANDYLEEEDREAFVDGLLEKHGYQRETRWAPPAQDPHKPRPGGTKRPGFYGGKR